MKKDTKTAVPLTELLEAGCHFGHQVRRWNPRMKPYIWKSKGGIHIFDLPITAQKIQEAMDKITELVSQGGLVVFVGTKRQAKDIVKTEAERAGMPYVVSRWPGGLLTNWGQIEKSIKRLVTLKKDKKEGVFNKYTKKENILIDRQIQRLERLFGGLQALTKPPEALFVIDTVREKTAIKEAKITKTPVLAITDTNSDPDMIDYLVPANDDAVRSIRLITAKMADAAISGIGKRKNPPKE